MVKQEKNTIGNFFDKKEGKTYTLNEGNVIVSEGYSCINGSYQKFFNFENPVEPEGFVEFDTTGEDLMIHGATSLATHIIEYKSELPAGKYPQESVSDGSYKRHVTAYKLKTGEMTLPLSNENAEIRVGDFLVIVDFNKGLDKYTGSTATERVCQALESKPANAGGYIIVNMLDDKIPVIPSGEA